MYQGSLHRENRDNYPKNSLSGKTHGISKFCQNTGNFVCSSRKFPDSKDTGYCNNCHNFFFFLKSVVLMKLAQGKFLVGQGK